MSGVELHLDETVQAIYKAFEDNHKPWLRLHIGGSDIGKECDRRLWSVFHHARTTETHPGRILRLFETGHLEEARLVRDLKMAGFQVWDRGEDGKQLSYSAINGHLVVNIDGVILGIPEAPKTPHLLELKTAKSDKMDDLEGKTKKGIDPKKRGVLVNYPEYWDQVQLCMGLAGLERCLFLCACKDDDRIYEERIRFDPKRFEQLMLRAQRIISATEAPERISKDPAFFKCKYCPVLAMCHGNKIPEKNCRTCVQSEPGPDGKWICNRGLDMVPGCNEHLYHPSLLDNWATPVDGDPTWIRYRIHQTGVEFVNVTAGGFPAMDVPHWESSELVNTSALMIGNEAVESARHILGGTVESTTEYVVPKMIEEDVKF